MSDSNENEKMIIGGSDMASAGKSGFFRRRLVWITIVVIVILLGVGGGLMAHRSRSLPKKSPGPTVSAQEQKVDNTQNQAEVAANKQGSAAGLTVYNQAIAKATDNQTRGMLNMDAAEQELSNGDFSGALTYALKADGLLHTSDSSNLVANVYDQQADYPDAVTYYDKAAAEVPASSSARDNDKQFYLHGAQAAEAAEK